jgi:hypothetical protein
VTEPEDADRVEVRGIIANVLAAAASGTDSYTTADRVVDELLRTGWLP